MKKVWLIGDSIRIGYQPHVAAALSEIAVVAGPEDNCRFAKYTHWYIDIWSNDLGKPDVIHWNNGMWDVYRHAEDGFPFTSLDEYVATMKKVLDRLKKYRVPLIWATTTPVKQGHPHCRNEEIDRYNEAIIQLMQTAGVAINDLNTVIRTHSDIYIGEDGMHLTDQGSMACAKAVADAVNVYLDGSSSDRVNQ